MIRNIRRKADRKKSKACDRAADFLSRFLTPTDFEKVVPNKVNKVEGEPEISKAQPIEIQDFDLSDVNGREDVFVTDENGAPLKFEIEEVSDDRIFLWIYNTWKRDGSVQTKVLFGDCKHPRVNKWIQKLRVSAFDDSMVAVWYLD